MKFVVLLLVIIMLCFVDINLTKLHSQRHKRLKQNLKKNNFWFFEKVAIVRQHNKLREAQHASNMEKMHWDTALEELAQKWANKCWFKQNPRRTFQQDKFSSVGENLFYTTGKLNGRVDGFINMWYSEIKNFTYTTNSCKQGELCDHYTQLVWHNTKAVGCGVKYCRNPKGIERKSLYIVVCDYGPSGNLKGERPFNGVQSCSQCPPDKGFCEYGLCSLKECGGLKCHNGGKLILSVCMCDCRRTKFTGNTCTERRVFRGLLK